jgi:Tol biopolymer transport system component
VTTEQRINDLVEQWRTGDRSRSAEQLCAACPELVDEVRRRIGQLTPASPLGSTILATPENQAAETIPMRGWLAAGAQPVGGYVLIKKLGQGGFGEVWEATGPGGIQVAMKFVPLAEQQGTIELTAFQIIKHIRHPNLLAIFGAWQVRGCLIVAMELADGTLMDRYEEVVRQGLTGISRRELLRHTRDAAVVLDYLNKPRHFLGGKKPVGIQHCDIKPQNLLLLGGGLKVADFGLARILEGAAGFHSGGLTPAYAAPELFEGQMSRHSDQYALAVTWCQLRGGRLPFTGTFTQVKDGHLGAPPDLSMLPAAERPVVQRALAKRPQERWPNCRAFVKALIDSARSAPSSREREELEGVVVPMSPQAATDLTDQATTDFFAEPAPVRSRTWKAAAPARSGLRWFLAGALGAGLCVSAAVGVVWLVGNSARDQFGGVGAQLAQRNASEIAKPVFKEAPVDRVAAEPPPTPPPDLEPIRPLPPEPAAKTKSLSAPSGPDLVRLQPPPAEPHPPTMFALPKALAGQPPPVEPLVEHIVEAAPPTTHLAMAQPAPTTPASEPLPAEEAAAPEPDSAAASGWPVELGLGAVFVFLLLLGIFLGWRRRRPTPDEHLVLVGHEDGVWSVACSPIADVIATGSLDNTVRLWDRRTGLTTGQLVGHAEAVTAVAFSPDGKRLVSASLDNSLRLWDLAGRRELLRFEGHADGVTSVACSPDGRQLLSGGLDGTLRLWDAASGQELAVLEQGAEVIWTVAFSPDGRHALSAGGGRSAEDPTRGSDFDLKLWDLAARREVRRFTGHAAAVRGVAFSPDGKHVASGSADRSVRLWDLATGREERRCDGHADWVRGVAFAPDGQTLASASDDETARLWRTSDGTQVACYQEHDWSVTSVVFTPDGSSLVTASDDMMAQVHPV